VTEYILFPRRTTPAFPTRTKNVPRWEKNMDRDAINLFDEDRRRFLAILRDFLENPNVPFEIKRETISSTQTVLHQLYGLVGPNRSIGG
jgi:hypothetical protein